MLVGNRPLYIFFKNRNRKNGIDCRIGILVLRIKFTLLLKTSNIKEHCFNSEVVGICNTFYLRLQMICTSLEKNHLSVGDTYVGIMMKFATSIFHLKTQPKSMMIIYQLVLLSLEGLPQNQVFSLTK